MKRFNAFLLTVFIVSTMLVITTSKAICGGNVSVVPIEGSKKAEVMLVNNEQSKINVSIENKEGNVSYYEKNINENEVFYKVLDFTLMKNGEYKLVARFADGNTIEKAMIVKNTSVKIVEPKEEITSSPYFVQNGSKFKVFYNNIENRELKVVIYDGADSIYESDSYNSETFTKTFDLRNLKSGDYDVTLYIGSKPFYYRVDI